jgi:NAD(P)-dependent dehydrogenase (short-subunit alcohol dehydrogenase family)
MDFLGSKFKRVVVSGCFSGIGRSTARLLQHLGAEVHGLDYQQSKLELASFTKTDLRDPASIDAAIGAMSGKIDALFNCAGLPPTCPPLDVMKVNYVGTRYLTELMLPLMPPGGAIVTVASAGGREWSRRLAVVMPLLQIDSYAEAVAWCTNNMETVRDGYSLSKEAVIAWTMSSAAQLIKRGIRINCTLPGPTQTPMLAQFEAVTRASTLAAAIQPINRRSTPEEQAGPLVFLNSDAATYINGAALAVDGGFLGGLATGQISMENECGQI